MSWTKELIQDAVEFVLDFELALFLGPVALCPGTREVLQGHEQGAEGAGLASSAPRGS